MSEASKISDRERFLEVVARFRKNDVPLTDDAKLLSMGVDSLSTISLLVDIEATMDIQIPDEMLSAEAFESVGSLWTVVRRCTE